MRLRREYNDSLRESEGYHAALCGGLFVNSSASTALPLRPVAGGGEMHFQAKLHEITKHARTILCVVLPLRSLRLCEKYIYPPAKAAITYLSD